jgi:exodeoxyribonuclease VII large subunit
MDPEEGMRIRAFGQLTVYEARGEYQLVARSLEGEGEEGLWKLAFERLRSKLDQEGLLRPERKRPLPRFPRTVGIVTSLSGAALHDILTVLRRRAPWIRVLVRGVRVQGEGAAEEIADGIRVMGASGLVEVLIIGRGGGSQEDLWAFNEEPVARAVADSPVPLISAVGHEVDVTISDLVADLRAPTPSAAAEAVAPDGEEIRRYLENAASRLARGLQRGVERRKAALDGALRSLARGLQRGVERRKAALDGASRSLARAARTLVRGRRQALGRLGGKMDALSPLATLRRGYSVALDPEGRVLRRADEFEAGTRFQLRVVDGRIECETQGVRRDEVIPQEERDERG